MRYKDGFPETLIVDGYIKPCRDTDLDPDSVEIIQSGQTIFHIQIIDLSAANHLRYYYSVRTGIQQSLREFHRLFPNIYALEIGLRKIELKRSDPLATHAFPLIDAIREWCLWTFHTHKDEWSKLRYELSNPSISQSKVKTFVV